MRFLSKVAVAALLALGMATAGRAQEPLNPLLPVQGTREIELRGAFQFEPENSFFVHLGYGPFLSPKLQIGGSLDYNRADDFDSTELGLFANYHFPSASATLPFVGAFLGFRTGDGDDSTSYGLQAGVKHFLNSSVALTGALVYRQYEDSITEGGDDNSFGINFGLAVYLR